MSIYFNEKFKQLRKTHDLTQDQIADIFHVSAQSVSRWETGANYPDIELLPHIAMFFKVTLDELLGMELIADDKKAADYEKNIRNLLNAGKLDDAIDMAHKAVKEYPVNYGLQGLLLQALCTSCSAETPEYEENTEKYKNEIIAIGERINACKDQNAVLWHKWQLIRQYAAWGMKEEAKKIVDTLPSEAYFTQDYTLKFVLEGEEWSQNQKDRIIRFAVILGELINEYGNKSDLKPLQKIDCIKAAGQIYRAISPITSDGGSEPEDYIGSAFGNIRFAGLYCEAGDIENALDYLEKAAQASMHHIEQMDKTNDDGSNYMAWSTPRNLPWVLWEDHLSKPQFDIIRSDKRFIKCFESLKANSRELK